MAKDLGQSWGRNTRQRGSVIWFDRAVPSDLKKYLGRSRWRWSLQTGDPKTAKRLAGEANASIDDLIDRYRKLGDRLPAVLTALRDYGITPPDGSPEAGTFEGVLTQLEAMEGYHDQREAKLASNAKVGTLKVLLDKGHSVEEAVQLEERSQADAARDFREHKEAAQRAVSELYRSGGSQPSKSPKGSLWALADQWEAERQPTPSAALDCRTAIRRFEEVNGPIPVTKIKAEHVAAFRAALIQLPRRMIRDERAMSILDIIARYEGTDYERLSPSTTQKLLGMIKTLLNLAKQSGQISTDPASGITISAKKRGKRLDFDREELAAIVAALPDAEGDIPWMGRLAIATGARAGELITLTTDDVKREGGITYLEITDDGDGKSLKTEGSRRRVPVHPVLVEAFTAWVGTREGRLFESKPDSHGKASGLFSKRANYWLRSTVGITDKRLTWHSFRHSFKTLCRDAGVYEDVHDALTGHASNSVGRGYGSFPLETLAREIAKIKLP